MEMEQQKQCDSSSRFDVELEKIRKYYEGVVRGWEARVRELEARVGELEGRGAGGTGVVKGDGKGVDGSASDGGASGGVVSERTQQPHVAVTQHPEYRRSLAHTHTLLNRLHSSLCTPNPLPHKSSHSLTTSLSTSCSSLSLSLASTPAPAPTFDIGVLMSRLDRSAILVGSIQDCLEVPTEIESQEQQLDSFVGDLLRKHEQVLELLAQLQAEKQSQIKEIRQDYEKKLRIFEKQYSNCRNCCHFCTFASASATDCTRLGRNLERQNKQNRDNRKASKSMARIESKMSESLGRILSPLKFRQGTN